MKAIVQNAYGSSEVLTLKEVNKPAVKENDLLVRVNAAAVNAGDAFMMKGSPWLIRLYVGFPKPKNYILGWDLAGHVEAVGENVKRFKPGDEVFGSSNRTFAEYVSANADNIPVKPANLTFEQAAAVPTAALTALQGLRDKRRVEPGHKVLINGTSGGVGHFAVQVAKSLGAEVTGVWSTKNVDMVLSLGTDNVVDYTKEDFGRSGEQYDLILDNVANRKFSDLRRSLKPQGILVPNSGHGGMSYVIKAALLSLFIRKQGSLLMTKVNHEDLDVLSGLIISGKMKPVIDRTYPLSETPEAVGYVAEGHASGKVVITVENDG